MSLTRVTDPCAVVFQLAAGATRYGDCVAMGGVGGGSNGQYSAALSDVSSAAITAAARCNRHDSTPRLDTTAIALTAVLGGLAAVAVIAAIISVLSHRSRQSKKRTEETATLPLFEIFRSKLEEVMVEANARVPTRIFSSHQVTFWNPLVSVNQTVATTVVLGCWCWCGCWCNVSIWSILPKRDVGQPSALTHKYFQPTQPINMGPWLGLNVACLLTRIHSPDRMRS